MGDLPIYNCHIHTFTDKHVPRYFLKMVFGPFWGVIVSVILNTILNARRVWMDWQKRLAKWKPPVWMKPLVWIRSLWIVRLPLWILGRIVQLALRFLGWSAQQVLSLPDWSTVLRLVQFFETPRGDRSQGTIFEEIQKQYPQNTFFVVLPMDMKYMELGPVQRSIDDQHQELLEIAAQSQGHLIPFYAVDPRREDIVERVKENLAPDKFCGVKIYPNLGYHPRHKRLMEVYAICEERGMPVMTHCSPGGVFRYRLADVNQRRLSNPGNYVPILEEFPALRLCLAHFGGGGEWGKQLMGGAPRKGKEGQTWVQWIGDLIRSGDYPNLYTDISYTLFLPRLEGFYFNDTYFDYLKVLLADIKVREHVLYGSDYYMVKREALSEKEVSIVLRSRLGDDWYLQIANKNPEKYLGIEQKDNSGKRPVEPKLAHE